eukprot:TRINITY_DN33976_c0_g1_i1.p1 TRINITY_DN33976_c0_g1~~TRINITY_DN33976_c0_g1_i1.p1  ORF type:complete len:211 (-),score=48.09 TRINITY_DN33976_c0_g1_i1:136-768(-)
MASSQAQQAHDKRQAKWVLALCLERCYKEECAKEREALSAYARSKQGVLVCFRRAEIFEKWAYTNTKPYVFISGWREAKPSLPAIKFWLPDAFFLLAEHNTANMMKANTWAAENGATIMNSLGDVIDHLVQELPGRSEGDAVHGRDPPKTSGPLLPEREEAQSGMMQEIFSSDSLRHTSDLLGFVRELATHHREEVQIMLHEAMPSSYED